ncbi:MAG: ABC transporter permease [Bacillota bacterium]
MTSFTALYKTALRQFLRDRMAILFTVLLPLLMAAFFGMIFASEPAFHLTVGVAAPADDPVAAAVVKALEAPALAETITLRKGSRAELESAVTQGEIPLALILPEGLTAAAGRGAGEVTVLYDQAQHANAAPGISIIRQLVQEMNLSLAGATPALKVAEEGLEVRQIPPAQLYVPGMLSLAMLWLGVFGTAPPLVIMREQQVLRRLGATPLKRSTLLASQVAFRVTTGLLQAALLVGYGILAYGMNIAGSWLPFLGVVLLGALVFVTLGFLLASVARTNESAVAIGQAVQFPMMFLSGILFPVEMLPEFLRPVTAAMPLTYLGDALRQTMLGAAPLYPLWVDLTVLGGVLVVMAALSVRLFRWE